MTSQLSRHWPKLLFAAGTLWILVSLILHFGSADKYASEQSYPRVDVWIQSVHCTKSLGTFSLACPMENGIQRYIPIENISCGDDAGHALIGSAVTLFSSVPVDRASFVRINFFLNALGIFLLASCLFFTGDFFVSFAVLCLGANFALLAPAMNADVTSAHFGIACLALVPSLWWLREMNSGFSSKLRWRLVCLTCVTSLTAAVLLRESVGRIGEVCAVFPLLTLIPGVISEARKRVLGASVSRLLTIAGCVIFAHFAIYLVNGIRDNVFPTEAVITAPSHGIYHSLYIGLGNVPNSFGIESQDEFATKKVQEIDPTAQYLSFKHFEILRGLYWRTVAENPKEALRIYYEKTLKLLRVDMLSLAPLGRVLLTLLLMCGLAAWLVRPFPAMEFLLVSTFTFFYLLQGVLAAPSWVFIYGSSVPIALAMLLMARLLLCRRTHLI